MRMKGNFFVERRTDPSSLLLTETTDQRNFRVTALKIQGDISSDIHRMIDRRLAPVLIMKSRVLAKFIRFYKPD